MRRLERRFEQQDLDQIAPRSDRIIRHLAHAWGGVVISVGSVSLGTVALQLLGRAEIVAFRSVSFVVIGLLVAYLTWHARQMKLRGFGAAWIAAGTATMVALHFAAPNVLAAFTRWFG